MDIQEIVEKPFSDRWKNYGPFDGFEHGAAYVEAKINDMSPHELLIEISNAFRELYK